MSAPNTPDEKKNPLKEIIQPFIDLFHAPRALWGINLAYVIEGMVYFGMLGYLSIYVPGFIFQAIDGADEAAHYVIMVLTAGITIAMFFLGVVADKRGVRFALITAFIFMLVGRCIWAGAPNVLGLEPVRPGVMAGDKVTLHVTEVDTRYGNKAITKSTVMASEEDSLDVDRELKLDLAEGEGTAPSAEFESKLVRMNNAKIVSGEGEEWKVQYGSKPVTAKLLIHSGDDLQLQPGATISLERAYVTNNEDERDPPEDTPEQRAAEARKLRPGATVAVNRAQVMKLEKDGDEFVLSVQSPEDVGAVDTSGCEESAGEYVIRSHWVSDVAALNTFPLNITDDPGIKLDAAMESWRIQLDDATIVEGEDGNWYLEYGQEAARLRLVVNDDTIEAIKAHVTTDLARGQGVVPDESLTSGPVQVGEARLISQDGDQWEIEYGEGGIRAELLVQSGADAPLSPGALISLRRADVVKDAAATQYRLRAGWPEDFAAIDTSGCEEPPFAKIVTSDEKELRAESRTPLPESIAAPQGASDVVIAELREQKDGDVNCVLRDVYVTYVRNGGYMVQADKDGPGIFVFVSPFWSSLQIVTMVGMVLVVIGYGMYQPAAYAGVRQFTTPKTAAMGFAMLYALMNLGGWLPSFAFLLRDDDYLNLGIPGTFWVYAGFTLVALLCTFIILSRRTVANAIASAKEETARVKAEEQANNEEAKSEEDAAPAAEVETNERPRVKPHMWLFWLGVIAIFLFKGEAPWYHSWDDAPWRWIIAGIFFISPAFLAAIRPARNWIARHPLENGKFAFFIFALIPVQTLFTYNWLVLPAYINRAFEGWIGDKFEVFANANPILIFIAVPIIAAATQRAKVYNMMIYGTFVMAAPAFLLVLGPHWWALLGYILIMTIGEAMWQPRFLQYAAEIAPEGRTGEYMGVAQLPWFLTKVLVPLLYSGRMMDRFCPAEGVKNTEIMWFIFACIAMTSTIFLILAKGWIGKDFKTKHDG